MAERPKSPGALLLNEEEIQEENHPSLVTLYECSLSLLYDNETGRMRVQVGEAENFPYDEDNVLLLLNAAMEEMRGAKAISSMAAAITRTRNGN